MWFYSIRQWLGFISFGISFIIILFLFLFCLIANDAFFYRESCRKLSDPVLNTSNTIIFLLQILWVISCPSNLVLFALEFHGFLCRFVFIAGKNEPKVEYFTQ